MICRGRRRFASGREKRHYTGGVTINGGATRRAQGKCKLADLYLASESDNTPVTACDESPGAGGEQEETARVPVSAEAVPRHSKATILQNRDQWPSVLSL